MSKPDPGRYALPDAIARLAAGADAVKNSIDSQRGRMYD